MRLRVPCVLRMFRRVFTLVVETITSICPAMDELPLVSKVPVAGFHTRSVQRLGGDGVGT